MAALKVVRNLLMLLLLLHSANATIGVRFDSIYQFGDSISDTGNLMMESNVSFCSFPPYGESYLSKPTGRCSDGLLMVDFFAKAFNLPLLEPYLKKDANFTHGVNFAVAGATALDGTLYPGAPTNSSLDVQLKWFRAHLNTICPNSSDCKQIFNNTLFLMGEVGGNDYNYALIANQNIQNVLSIVPQVVRTIIDAADQVIAAGAVQLIIPGNFPIGCMPAYLGAFRSNDSTLYDNLGCLKPLNEFARFHNNYLQQAIRALQERNPNVTIHYGDYYSGFLWVLRNAGLFGFEKDGVLTPCCGDVVHFCGGKGVSVCLDPKKRISWDGVHLTQEAYGNMARWLFENIFPAPAAPTPYSSPAPAPYRSESSNAGAVSFTMVLSCLALLVIGSKLL